jgi:hypothetical protein
VVFAIDLHVLLHGRWLQLVGTFVVDEVVDGQRQELILDDRTDIGRLDRFARGVQGLELHVEMLACGPQAQPVLDEFGRTLRQPVRFHRGRRTDKTNAYRARRLVHGEFATAEAERIRDEARRQRARTRVTITRCRLATGRIEHIELLGQVQAREHRQPFALHPHRLQQHRIGDVVVQQPIALWHRRPAKSGWARQRRGRSAQPRNIEVRARLLPMLLEGLR